MAYSQGAQLYWAGVAEGMMTHVPLKFATSQCKLRLVRANRLVLSCRRRHNRLWALACTPGTRACGRRISSGCASPPPCVLGRLFRGSLYVRSLHDGARLPDLAHALGIAAVICDREPYLLFKQGAAKRGGALVVLLPSLDSVSVESIFASSVMRGCSRRHKPCGLPGDAAPETLNLV